IYPNATLGNERESLELMNSGALQMVKVNAASLESFAPEYSVFTRHKDEVMNEGHHVTLLASRDPNFNRLTNHRVALIWQPPSR
ncbi:hypothetical protein MJL81_33750, partial [Salmonella enterica subsp. enterica serovar Anatum]|nr:hypothetical protein [Salmonella enterica subsp. enterica serovar Anatum]